MPEKPCVLLIRKRYHNVIYDWLDAFLELAGKDDSLVLEELSYFPSSELGKLPSALPENKYSAVLVPLKSGFLGALRASCSGKIIGYGLPASDEGYDAVIDIGKIYDTGRREEEGFLNELKKLL